MHPKVKQHGPATAVMALVAWCCWTQVSESRPLLPDMGPATSEKIELRSLNPEIEPPSARDPFAPPVIPVDEAPTSPVCEIEVEPPPAPVFDVRLLLASFRLDATVVSKNQRLAMINGQVYREGQSIDMDELPDVDCHIQQVLPDSVLLQIEQVTHKLDYTGAAPSSTSTPAPPEAIPPQADSRGVDDAISQPNTPPTGLSWFPWVPGAVAEPEACLDTECENTNRESE
jgi:hypothetical protein